MIRVEFTEKENTYCYTGEWIGEEVEAENEEEAIELIKQYIVENEDDPDKYIFRIGQNYELLR